MIYQAIMILLCLIFLAPAIFGMIKIGQDKVSSDKEGPTLIGCIFLIIIAAIVAKLAGI